MPSSVKSNTVISAWFCHIISLSYFAGMQMARSSQDDLWENPLLATCNGPMPDDAIYDRFMPGQTRKVFIISSASLLPTSFIHSIPQLANEDLELIYATVSFTVSLSVFAVAVGVLFWAAHSSFYGCRLMYLSGMPFLCIGSCAIATSTVLRGLLF